jgi:hypothetical protein
MEANGRVMIHNMQHQYVERDTERPCTEMLCSDTFIPFLYSEPVREKAAWLCSGKAEWTVLWRAPRSRTRAQQHGGIGVSIRHHREDMTGCSMIGYVIIILSCCCMVSEPAATMAR